MAQNDQGASPDAPRPQPDSLNPNDPTVLGRPDQGASPDATRPQPDTGTETKANP